MKNKKSIETKSERKIPVIYVGADIRNVLKRYSVFTNGIPYENAEIKNAITECPVLEKLFIPVHELNNWEKKANQKGSLEQMHFKSVADYFSK